jgi:type II secretory pathway predicted ATPase ExeA
MDSLATNTSLLQHAMRDEALNERREEIGLLHPLMTKDVLLPTKPINELFLAIRRVVAMRETGCCFTGHSGVGKSSALEVVDAMLRIKMPKLCVVHHDTHSQQMPSIRAFFKHFLTSVKHSQLKGETFDLRQRLVNWLVDEAKLSGLNLVVIFIDEAQLMTIQDFNFLKDVFNDLSKDGVQLITILMAQSPDFDSVIDTLKNERRLDLIGRFAMRILPFRAYNCAEDLKLILNGIDMAVFPERSGITWTEFYFPNAFGAGFRLVGQLDSFMHAITTSAPKTKPMHFDFPARQTFMAIRAFMLNNAGADCAGMSVADDAWKKAVEYAKIADAMEMMRVSDRSVTCAIEV